MPDSAATGAEQVPADVAAHAPAGEGREPRHRERRRRDAGALGREVGEHRGAPEADGWAWQRLPAIWPSSGNIIGNSNVFVCIGSEFCKHLIIYSIFRDPQNYLFELSKFGKQVTVA